MPFKNKKSCAKKNYWINRRLINGNHVDIVEDNTSANNDIIMINDGDHVDIVEDNTISVNNDNMIIHLQTVEEELPIVEDDSKNMLIYTSLDNNFYNEEIVEHHTQNAVIVEGNNSANNDDITNLEAITMVMESVAEEENEGKIANSDIGSSTVTTSLKKEDPCQLQGTRSVNMPTLNHIAEMQWSHSKICDGLMSACKETRIGLYSEILFKCCECKKMKVIKTFPDAKDINRRAVVGVLSSGGTYKTLQQLYGVKDHPLMSYKLYRKLEVTFFQQCEKLMGESMAATAHLERDLAIKQGQIDEDDVPFIRVIVDGGWSHRSYGHGYNAHSGVAVIIGHATSQILFMGVKNNYCTIHARAENAGRKVPNHVCHRNWSSSSGSMEVAIIVEGFNQSVSSFGMKYLEFVADGDSTVYAKIRKECSYGAKVTKIECKNHAVKNYGKGLYKLKTDTSSVPLAARKLLTTTKIKALQDEAVKALTKHAGGDVEQLKITLNKGPRHVFGNHESCDETDCSQFGNVKSNWLQVEATGLIVLIECVLFRLIGKAHQLIANETSNRAETYMSLLSKYNAGKRLNLTGRDSFQGRAYFAGLVFNKGISWVADMWERISSRPPGNFFFEYVKSIDKNRQYNRQRKSGKEYKEKQRAARRKRQPIVQGEIEYGPEAPQALLSDIAFEAEKKKKWTLFKTSQKANK